MYEVPETLRNVSKYSSYVSNSQVMKAISTESNASSSKKEWDRKGSKEEDQGGHEMESVEVP